MVVHPLQKPVAAADVPPERLAGNKLLTEQQKIAEASRQFEAILLRQILAASQKTVISSKLADNSTASEIYHDMITSQLADSISKSGTFGLAQTFERQLSRPDHKDEKGAQASPSALGAISRNPARQDAPQALSKHYLGVSLTHPTSNHTHE